MRVPPSIERAYEEELAIIEDVRRHAGSRLRILAADNLWLFDDRIKRIESVLSKLETGRVSMRDMNDFYAAMIVVPTQNEVVLAQDAVLRAFSAVIKPEKGRESSSFVYDDLHCFAKLRGKISPIAVAHETVLDRLFEVQVHTAAQYAWWRADHDHFYKGTNPTAHSWGARRSSSQARASIELIDGVLANFDAAANLQKSGPGSDHTYLIPQGWLRLWNKNRRPTDELRFADSARGILLDSNTNIETMSEQLSKPEMRPFIDNLEVTPIQAILVACHMIGGDQIFDGILSARRRVLVTEELLDAYPAFHSLPLDARLG